MSEKPAVVIDGVTCRFGRICALDGLSLQVPRGRVTGIIGPNGAGKTTLLDVVTGLVRPSTGSVKVLGHDVAADSLAVRAQIGIVPQETALYEELTPIQNLEFSASLYGVTNGRRVSDVLELVGLTARARDRVSALSGGMQRRVAIARALVHDPAVLLLDEPTLGVDVEARHQIWNHVRRLRDDGRTVMLATNYLDEAEALCDTVAVLRSGRVAFHDTPAALVARAGRCLELECSAGDSERVGARIERHPLVSKLSASADRVLVYFDGRADPDELVREAMEVTRLRGFRVRSPDLMEVLRTIDGAEA
jgi:ABC-2 type transport system ATP-binding protein